ncbi:MAG TPA: hypothetical protein VK978_04725 [Candidatus Saccharimonadales bacterium]|nr:hypothetical protein [Candidatus Saccharimonadales bacterium]
MDFRNRGVPQQPAPASASSSTTGKLGRFNAGKILERGPIVLLFSVAIIIAALTAMMMFVGEATGKAIMRNKYQAVFLNNGQVYFGNISSISDRNLRLNNIYYLQTSGGDNAQAANANANVSLVKLGCELHGPYDQMNINNSQVLFWENLQDNSQVVKAIAQYKKDNPKGQTCSTQSQNSTQQAPSTTAPSGTGAAPAAGAGSNNTTASPQPTTTTPPTNRR